MFCSTNANVFRTIPSESGTMIGGNGDIDDGFRPDRTELDADVIGPLPTISGEVIIWSLICISL